MPTKKQIFAEIKNKLKVYDQQGLVDDISLNNWMKENIKEFGGNIMNEYQLSLRVENGRAKLPDNFWSLKGAVKCESMGYSKAEKKSEKHVQRRISYLEWTDIHDYYNWLEGKPCLEDSDSRYITETLFFETPNDHAPNSGNNLGGSNNPFGGGYYNFYYNNPQPLYLKPHVYKVRCDADCPNIDTHSPYEVSIDEQHNYITTNFNEGFIWLWYKGLPCDEAGDLMIPDTDRDKLKNYIIYFAIVRTLQDLLLSEDDPNVFNKLQVFQPLMEQYYYDAKSESISKGLLGWSTKLINNNRRNTNKYEFMFRTLTPNIYNDPYNPGRVSIGGNSISRNFY